MRQEIVNFGTVTVCVTHEWNVRKSVKFCGRPVCYGLDRRSERHTVPPVEKRNIRMKLKELQGADVCPWRIYY